MHILLDIDSTVFLCFVFNDVLWWDMFIFWHFLKFIQELTVLY